MKNVHAFAQATLCSSVVTLFLIRVPVKVVTVYRDDAEVNIAKAGENLRLRVSGIEEEDISSGFVACGRKNAVPAVTQFEAQLQVRVAVIVAMGCG